MKIIKSIFLTFYIITSLYASNYDVDKLASNISTPFYNIYTEHVIELIQQHIEENPQIEAIRVFDNLLEHVAVVYYKKNGEYIFEIEQDFPSDLNLSKVSYHADIIKNEQNIGTIELFVNSQSHFHKTNFTEQELDFIKNNKTISIAMMDNFKPFSFINNGKHQGLCVDIIHKISDISGLEFDIQTSRWSKALEKFKQNKVDMISGISHRKDREKFTLFSQPVFEIPTFIFGLKSDNLYINNKSLKGKTVAVSKDIFYIPVLKELGIKIKEYDSSTQKAQAVVTGKADYFLASYSTGQKAIVSQSLDTLKAIDEFSKIKKEDLRFGITKNNPLLHSIIKKSIKQIPSSTFLKLSAKWIINNTPQKNKTIQLSKEEKAYINNKGIIKVHNELAWAPYNHYYNGKVVGLSVDYMNLIAKKTGLKIKYISGPSWNEFLKMMKTDSLDVMLNIAKTPKREQYLTFTTPYIKALDTLFIPKNSPLKNASSLKDFNGKTIAVVKGFYEEELIKKHYPKIKLYLAENTVDAFKAVLFKKADATINIYAVGIYTIAKYSMNNIYPLFELKDNRFHLDLNIATSKNNKILNSIIQKGLNAITAEEYSNIQNKFIQKSNPKNIKKEFLTPKQLDYIRNKRTIKMCNNMDYAPIEFSFENLEGKTYIHHKMAGISIDILDLIAQKLNVKFEHVHTSNWAQAQEYLKDKKCDILPSSIKTDKRDQYTNFTKPYLNLEVAVINKKGSPFTAGIESILDQKIAKKGSSGMIDLLKKRYPDINIFETDSVKDTFIAVNKNKAFATLATLPVATYYIQKYGLNDLQIAGYTDIKYKIRIAVRGDDPLLASILDDTIDNIKQQDIQNIINKWSNIKIEQQSDLSIFYKIIIAILLILLLFIYWNTKLTAEQKKSQEAVKLKNESLERLSLALDVANTGTFEWDIVNDHIQWSDINHKIFGTDKETFAPNINSFLSFIPDFEKDSLRHAFQTAVRTKEPVKLNHYIKRPSGQIRFISENFKVIEYDDADNPVRVIGTLLDITEQKEMENHLIEAKNKAEESTKAKSNFLANMSHEIRTPMNAIIGMTHLIVQTDLNEKQKSFIEKIESASKNLLNIINDILDISKIEAGKLQIENINFDLDKVIKNVQNFVELKTDQKALKFNLIYDETKNRYFYGDPFRLNQILLNLCSNAVKFTDKGEITLEIKHLQNDRLLFKVKDSGIGLTNQQQKQLFQPFSQADESTTRKYGGTGLGLAISKQLVELMNGTISCNSTKGEGSEFIFDILLPKGEQNNIDSVNPKQIKDLQNQMSTLKGSKILLVEDNSLNIEIIHNILEIYHIKIDDAFNGKEAVEKIKNDPKGYELILMDIQMPIMDGFEATKKIKEINSSIPIVALTANAMYSDIKKTKDAGMSEHLSKPVEISKLYEVLLKLLPKKIKFNNTEKEKENFEDKQINYNFRYLDHQNALKMLNNNIQIYQNALNEFFTQYNTVKIVDIEDKQLHMLLHTMKALSGTIGAKKLSSMIIQKEIDWDKISIKDINAELQNVLYDIKDNLVILPKENIKKESITKEGTVEMFIRLEKAIQTRRPKNYTQIITKMKQYDMEQKYKELFNTIEKFASIYNYDEALKEFEKNRDLLETKTS